MSEFESDALPKTTAAAARELYDLGPDYVTTATSIQVLVYLAKRQVQQQQNQRARAVARDAEGAARRAQALARPARRSSAEVDKALVAEAYHAAAVRAIIETRDRWAELQSQEFAVNGRMVTWADASIDDHMARAASQRLLAAGIGTDAAMHERAAQDLQTFGVFRLGDLGCGLNEVTGA